MKEAKFKNYNDLPLMLSVPDLTEALGISRAGAYELVKRKDFPALHLGKRVLVPKEELIAWIKENTSRTG
ncbi:MAG: helix-turn-helix domain-containing protein [Ruminococcaceae bacterium]|nr:helix-turn-helix domain-containing protein [Oscillospiraceae bacterium]